MDSESACGPEISKLRPGNKCSRYSMPYSIPLRPIKNAPRSAAVQSKKNRQSRLGGGGHRPGDEKAAGQEDRGVRGADDDLGVARGLAKPPG